MQTAALNAAKHAEGWCDMVTPMNRPGQAMTPEQRAAEQDMNPNSVKNIGTIAQRAAADPSNRALQRRAAEQAQFRSMTPAQRIAYQVQELARQRANPELQAYRAKVAQARAAQEAKMGRPAAPMPPGGPRPGFGAANSQQPLLYPRGPNMPGVAPAEYTKGLAKGGKVSGNASGRADGCAQRGKTKGKMR